MAHDLLNADVACFPKGTEINTDDFLRLENTTKSLNPGHPDMANATLRYQTN
jgi:hypothetical protein